MAWDRLLHATEEEGKSRTEKERTSLVVEQPGPRLRWSSRGIRGGRAFGQALFSAIILDCFQRASTHSVNSHAPSCPLVTT